MLLVLDWIELTDFGQKHRNCVLDGMVGPPCIRCIAPLCQLTSTIERSVAAVMWPYVRLMWPLAMMLMSGCQHVIRKAVGSYGEALFLAVYLAFADKSQVVCLQLSYSAWVLLWVQVIIQFSSGCLELVEFSWNLKLLLEILEISWNFVDSPEKFYN